MAGGEFEIHVSRGGRWQLEGVDSSKEGAIASARRSAGGTGVEGVRVIQEETSRLGKVSQNILFEQQGRSGDTGVVTIGTIDAAPQRCEKPADLYGGGARQTMAKLFRNYTSKMNLTVSEILYNSRELKRVMEKDTLLSSAVSKVASLQSTAGDQQGAKGRRDELFAMIDQVVAKANAAEKAELPSIAAVGFAALEEKVASSTADPADRDYLLRVAISRDLMGERSFLGKLENAVKWADGTDPAAAIGALDEFIADVLTDPTVIQDVLGRRDNLLAAIVATMDLLEGQMTLATPAPPAADGADPIGARLNKLITAARVPGAVAVIAERLQSMIAAKTPLIREAAEKEETDAFRALVERLVPLDAPVRASPEILAALLERGARVVNKGGDAGRFEAAGYIAGLLVEPARKMRWLLAFHEATPQAAFKAHVVTLVRAWMADMTSAKNFIPDSKNPALVMKSVTNLFYHVRDGGFPAELVRPLLEHLEMLLFDYIEKAQILQMVDNPNRPLRARARLLMSMCLPEMLPPGKAVEAARLRVVDYLRQPDFTTQVVADLTDPAEKNKALRELFDLMRKAGFKMG